MHLFLGLVDCRVCREQHGRTHGFPHIQFGSIAFCGLGDTGGFSSVSTIYPMLLKPDNCQSHSHQTQCLGTRCRQTCRGKTSRRTTSLVKPWNQQAPNLNLSISIVKLKTYRSERCQTGSCQTRSHQTGSRRTRSRQRFVMVGLT